MERTDTLPLSTYKSQLIDKAVCQSAIIARDDGYLYLPLVTFTKIGKFFF